MKHKEVSPLKMQTEKVVILEKLQVTVYLGKWCTHMESFGARSNQSLEVSFVKVTMLS